MAKVLKLIPSVVSPDPGQNEKRLFQEALLEKYKELMPIRFARGTIPTFGSAMANFLPWILEKGLMVWDVRSRDYDEFAKHLENNIAKPTVVHYNYHISNFFDWMGSRHGEEIFQKFGLKVKNPIDEWNTPSRRGEEDELPEVPDSDVAHYYFQKEKHELAEAIQRQDRRTALILARQLTAEQIMLRAGLRVAEVAKLEIGDILLEDMVLIVRKGKGNKDRIVDIHEELAVLLKWYIANGHPAASMGKVLRRDQPLLLSEQKKHVAHKTLQHRLWQQQEQYQVPVDKRFSAHGLRRMFATNLYVSLAEQRHPDPLTYIKMQLGHVYYSTTLRYCRLPQAVAERAKLDAYASIVRVLSTEGGVKT